MRQGLSDASPTLASIEQLYAFYYTPSPPLQQSALIAPENGAAKGNGWSVYNPREEFARMGLGTRTKAWRFTDCTPSHLLMQYSPTYPAKLVVPSRISDSVLTYAAKYRSKARIPALAYLHWANHVSQLVWIAKAAADMRLLSRLPSLGVVNRSWG
jgi:myotubularin-related protein 6/7/8